MVPAVDEGETMRDGYFYARISDGEIEGLIEGHYFPKREITPSERREANKRIAYWKSVLDGSADGDLLAALKEAQSFIGVVVCGGVQEPDGLLDMMQSAILKAEGGTGR